MAAGLYETARSTRISGDRCIDMLVAADGRIYLCGFVHTAEADDQILLVCYDASGREVWRRELGGAETDRGGLLAQTPDGRLFYSARLTGAQTIDGIDIPSPADGVFFFEFDAQGRATDVVQLDIDHVSDIAHRGEVIIAAGAEMTKGRPTTVLAGFRADGREEWRSSLGSTSRICDMYAAPDGSIYLAGAFHENVSIGDETHSSEGVFDSDAFVAKYSDGRAEWFSRFGSKGNSRPGYRSGDIALSSLLLTGHARGGADRRFPYRSAGRPPRAAFAQSSHGLQSPAMSVEYDRITSRSKPAERRRKPPGSAARRFSPLLSRFALLALAASPRTLHIASTS